MKKHVVRTIVLMAGLLLLVLAAACGKKKEETKAVAEEKKEEPEVVEEVEETDPVGMYRSELTNEWIDESLRDQRPIAAMVDNELTALPHYGLSKADVVYEMMNSTMNGRITRLMVLVKDWGSIEQLGNIRSARTTNVVLSSEWNAILCHDGGPFYINSYLSQPCTDHISGGFSRISNGKSREYTEYITTGEVAFFLEQKKISTTYNEYYEGTHFNFVTEKEQITPNSADAQTACEIILPFPHNSSTLTYGRGDGLYFYSEYGQAHVDPGNGNTQLSFKNVILQKCDYELLDENGYLTYDCIGSGEGYFITNGKAVPITWSKEAFASPTRFRLTSGEEITLNTGKTYIALVPSDQWDELMLNGATQQEQ